VLPTEGGLRKGHIQAFVWGSAELETRLNRIRQGELPIASRALTSIPLVERAFYEPIKTAKELAQLLAKAAREIEKVIPKVYKSEEKRYPASQGEEGYLHKLLKSFQQELLPTLRLDSENEKDYSFADIYAQTIAYALFTARVFSYVRDRKEGHKKETLFDRETAWQQLPETNPFLRRLFQDVSEQKAEDLGDELIGHIADIFAILRAAKMEAILQDFRQKMNREDIVIRFYEDFLAAYKPEMRERRGVYYTPEPVVSYMVRSVDVLLKEKFNKPLGLADPEVMILDPACGTGTFLLQIFQRIYDRFTGQEIEKQPTPEKKIEAQKVYRKLKAQFGDLTWNEYVKNHLLPRIFGFELLMAPYAIAHLKLGLFLEETGYQFVEGERLEIYLTNCLDISQHKPESLLGQYISDEANRALNIKRIKPIMVVTGNPPYSGHSANVGIQWIDDLLRGRDTETNQKTHNYFEVDGKPLGEKNPKWLNNDYVKFMRYAQWRISQTKQGIIALITDHSYLDNPTFRGMRQSLTESFDEIYIQNLHGNSRKRELSPDNSVDENVFDIQQGVSIGFFIKNFTNKRIICQFDLWGRRETCYSESEKSLDSLNYSYLSKYQWLENNDFGTTAWRNIKPVSPFYLFLPQSNSFLSEYDKGWKITDIFLCNSMGIATARDALTIQWSSSEVQKVIQTFASLSVEAARESFNLGEDAVDWQVKLAQKDIRLTNLNQKNIRPILYRPFDIRFTYYTGNSRGFHCRPRPEIMRQFVENENLGLCFIRRTRGEFVFNFYVSEHITDKTVLSSADNANIAPLYIYPETEAEKTMGITRRPNLSTPFLNAITTKLGYTPTPKAIFYYIYAIFHSPTYRTRYAEFLKMDFPRVPLTSNDALFRQLAAYGKELVALHLMKSPKLDKFITQFVDKGGAKVVAPAHPTYANGKVTINKKGDGFTEVPEEVWKFYVGGYPVCAKWLKDRKGRTLSDEDIAHYQRIVVALQETIKLMAAIDQAIPGFPIQ
jgi:predicted helicase